MVELMGLKIDLEVTFGHFGYPDPTLSLHVPGLGLTVDRLAVMRLGVVYGVLWELGKDGIDTHFDFCDSVSY